MSFEDSIKEWVSIDSKIRQHNEELREMRRRRTDLTQSVYNHVNDNNLNHATIQISDGKLKFQSVKVTQPITLKFIKKCLHDCIQNEEHVNTIMEHIKESRESKYIDDIKRFYN
jgi:carboxypeptidase C (cathepsin A)